MCSVLFASYTGADNIDFELCSPRLCRHPIRQHWLGKNRDFWTFPYLQNSLITQVLTSKFKTGTPVIVSFVIFLSNHPIFKSCNFKFFYKVMARFMPFVYDQLQIAYVRKSVFSAKCKDIILSRTKRSANFEVHDNLLPLWRQLMTIHTMYYRKKKSHIFVFCVNFVTVLRACWSVYKTSNLELA